MKSTSSEPAIRNNNEMYAASIEYYIPIPIGGERMGFGGDCKRGGMNEDVLIIIAIILLLIVLADSNGFKLFDAE